MPSGNQKLPTKHCIVGTETICSKELTLVWLMCNERGDSSMWVSLAPEWRNTGPRCIPRWPGKVGQDFEGSTGSAHNHQIHRMEALAVVATKHFSRVACSCADYLPFTHRPAGAAANKHAAHKTVCRRVWHAAAIGCICNQRSTSDQGPGEGDAGAA